MQKQSITIRKRNIRFIQFEIYLNKSAKYLNNSMPELNITIQPKNSIKHFIKLAQKFGSYVGVCFMTLNFNLGS